MKPELTINTLQGSATIFALSYVAAKAKNGLRSLGIKIPIPTLELKPLGTALVASQFVQDQKLKYLTALTCYSSGCSQPGQELLASILLSQIGRKQFNRLLKTQSPTVRKFAPSLLYCASISAVIYKWCRSDGWLGTPFQRFLDGHVGMDKAFLEKLRKKVAQNRWFNQEEASFRKFGKFVLQCAINCGKTLLSIYFVLELIRSLKHRQVIDLRRVIKQCLSNTIFLVYVFQSAILGPILWTKLQKQKVLTVAPPKWLQFLWWFICGFGIRFENYSRQMQISTFVASQVLIGFLRERQNLTLPLASLVAGMKLLEPAS